VEAVDRHDLRFLVFATSGFPTALAVAQRPKNDLRRLQKSGFRTWSGLITSTLLNLFVIPSLYLRFGASGRRPSYGALESPKVA
jgi:hypothetical protein